ncbi:hypothetical protein DPMN_061059 [Dreissena polymorpha]|uniref:Uncharacterized protein n=1 Tax=Dreissena polymorpha TaxID=45954 RepID=A0A9D4C752_DREPO|nr:hypothetical protein DPMN_061059 [Dreissena polymorpha]
MNDDKIEEMICFKFLGSTLSKDGTSTADVRIIIGMTINCAWTISSISFTTKYRRYR